MFRKIEISLDELLSLYSCDHLYTSDIEDYIPDDLSKDEVALFFKVHMPVSERYGTSDWDAFNKKLKDLFDRRLLKKYEGENPFGE